MWTTLQEKLLEAKKRYNIIAVVQEIIEKNDGNIEYTAYELSTSENNTFINSNTGNANNPKYWKNIFIGGYQDILKEKSNFQISYTTLYISVERKIVFTKKQKRKYLDFGKEVLLKSFNIL